MLRTKTGNFPIGFRRGGSPWQKDLTGLLNFAKKNDFAGIDLHADADQSAAAVKAAGLAVGSADLPDWKGLVTADAARRAATVARCRDYITAAAKAGVKNFFTVVQADDPALAPADALKLATEGYKQLDEILAKCDAWIVIEGWPGPGVCVHAPEGYRAILAAGSRLAVNYDPSHLIRMGIDPIRFLREFAPRVHHIHGKDTELIPEALYECGWEKPAALTRKHGYGSAVWRYTIPGDGQMRWKEAFAILRDAGYAGAIGIELEDENYNGTEAGEQEGLRLAGAFLAGC